MGWVWFGARVNRNWALGGRRTEVVALVDHLDCIHSIGRYVRTCSQLRSSLLPHPSLAYAAYLYVFDLANERTHMSEIQKTVCLLLTGRYEFKRSSRCVVGTYLVVVGIDFQSGGIGCLPFVSSKWGCVSAYFASLLSRFPCLEREKRKRAYV